MINPKVGDNCRVRTSIFDKDHQGSSLSNCACTIIHVDYNKDMARVRRNSDNKEAKVSFGELTHYEWVY